MYLYMYIKNDDDLTWLTWLTQNGKYIQLDQFRFLLQKKKKKQKNVKSIPAVAIVS